MKAERLKAVIFDWAGTTVDFGSLAPVLTLQQVFKAVGLPITEAEARRDMGIAKRNHIANILSIPRVAEAWASLHGTPHTDADAEEIYRRFIPLQFACLLENSSVIPGVPELTQDLRGKGLRIGSTTGYTRAMLDLLVENAAKQGYSPDCSLTPEDAGSGRPGPFMIYEAAIRLQVYPMAAFVKVGDTVADVEEGLNAGVWTVAVVETGNMMGLRREALQALPVAEKEARSASARALLKDAGAHYIIDTLAQLKDVLTDIDKRLTNGHIA